MTIIYTIDIMYVHDRKCILISGIIIIVIVLHCTNHACSEVDSMANRVKKSFGVKTK